MDDINYTVILKDFLQKAILNVNENVSIKKNWLSLDILFLKILGHWRAAILCSVFVASPGVVGHVAIICCIAQVHAAHLIDPHFKDVHSINNKAGKYF